MCYVVYQAWDNHWQKCFGYLILERHAVISDIYLRHMYSTTEFIAKQHMIAVALYEGKLTCTIFCCTIRVSLFHRHKLRMQNWTSWETVPWPLFWNKSYWKLLFWSCHVFSARKNCQRRINQPSSGLWIILCLIAVSFLGLLILPSWKPNLSQYHQSHWKTKRWSF